MSLLMQESLLKIPPDQKNFFKKCSRSGIGSVFVNWKLRYFILSKGVIKYYKNEDDVNQGIPELGRLILVGAKVAPSTGLNKNIIHVIASNLEKDIKLEAPTGTLYDQWIIAIEEHIEYADANQEFVLRM